MKTRRIFKGSRFLLAAVIAVVVAEAGAAWFTRMFDLPNKPIVVGFVAVGLVAFAASVIYEGCDYE